MRSHIIFVIFCFTSFQAATADDKSAIIDAWSRRQERVHSFHFEWDQVMRKLAAPGGGGSPDAATRVWTEVSQRGEFRLSGDRIDNRLSSESGAATTTPGFLRGTYDGNSSRRYGQQAPDATQTGTGYVNSVPYAYGVREAEVAPLLLTYRPLHPVIGKIDPKRSEVLPQKRQIGEHVCLILQVNSPSGVVDTYWVDPSRDYIILRYTSAFQGRDSVRLDIEYERNQFNEWVPKKWRRALVDENGQPRLTKEASMTRSEVNVSIPAAEFAFDFPDGTVVFDQSGGNQSRPQTYWVGERPADGRAARDHMRLLVGVIVAGVTIVMLFFYARRAWQHA